MSTRDRPASGPAERGGRRAMDDDDLRIARAIYAALVQTNPNAFVQGEPGEEDRTTIDGHFDLVAVGLALKRSGLALDQMPP